MKLIFYIFLYLNIYTIFSSESFAQKFTLEIKGEISISESLKDSIQFVENHPDVSSVKSEADSIATRLQRIGYIESVLRNFQKKNDSVFTARYFLGNKYQYIKVYFSETDISKKELQQVTSEIYEDYFILPYELTAITLQKLNTLKTNQGNAFSRIRLSELEIENTSTLTATLHIDSGVKRIVDEIIVKGYEKFPISFIKYYAGVRKGKTFSRKKILDQNQSLNNLGFVTTLKEPEVLFKKDSTTVYFYLEKQTNNTFDGILGFATNEDTQKLEFNGYLDIVLNNNLNFGEHLRINYKADGKEQVNFEASTDLPYLFKSPFGLGAGLKIFKRDSTFVTTNQLAKVTYQINPRSNSYIGYKFYESSNLRETTPTTTPIEDYTSNFIITGITYFKGQQSSLFPNKSFASLESEIGRRNFQQEKENQLRFSITASTIFNLNYSNSIFIKSSSSLLSTNSYFTNELFRFGGINSIRGFDENSIDASLFSILNTEYRYQFSPNLYLHSIIDLGYFENAVINIKQNLFSFGIGLGINSKSGLFKLNFANGRSENQVFNFSNSKIHISFSSKF
ncbi:hypothetical protein ACFQO1_10435 [Jejudonia soesokkakensis]|uniref:POTRA domain-containing protein n=1 Tax=Jejudonia soesokkakensis TaxID=1323432 RepID=A0ABW2MVD7_9FLAO